MIAIAAHVRSTASVAALTVCLVVAPAAAAVKLPETLAWSTYDVGSSGYNQSVAIGAVLKRRYSVNLRVLPGNSDAARESLLRDGKVAFVASGIGGAYFAQEGVFEFGTKNWGPQPVRAVLLNDSEQLLTLVAAADSGIKTIADLRGKRLAWIVGSPSLNQNVTALLAFARLTWSDVKRVEFASFSESIDGIVNNKVDAAFGSSISGKVYQMERSPRGLVYPVVAHNDKDGWRRLHAVAPFFAPATGTEGAGISAAKPIEAVSYPYPILITYRDQDADLVYNLTKAMAESFTFYKNSAPGNGGWDVKRQVFDWAVPWHDGAIKYFKEIGVWKREYQAHNDRLIERQRVLARAWAALKKERHADDTAFAAAWMHARAEALRKAQMEPVVTRW